MRGYTHAHTESRYLSHAPITENENFLRSLTLSLDHNTVNAVNPHTESTATRCIKFFLKTTRRRGHTLCHFRRVHVFLLTHALAYQKRCHLDLQELELKTEYGLPGANTALTHQFAPEKPIPLHMLVSDTNASTPSSVPNSHCKDCTSVSPGDIWSIFKSLCHAIRGRGESRETRTQRHAAYSQVEQSFMPEVALGLGGNPILGRGRLFMHSDRVRGPGRASVLLLSFFGVCPIDLVDPSALASQPPPKRTRARMPPSFFSALKA